MSLTKCPYELLGVSRTATKEEIRKAYHSKALTYHPDRCGIYIKEDYETIFVEITAARDLLMDDKKRQMYDIFGIIDDGQTEIVVDDATVILSKLNEGLGGDGFYPCYTEKEPLNPTPYEDKRTICQKFRDFCLGERTYRIDKCHVCKGKGTKREERGFLVIDEECWLCKGTGELQIEITYPNSRTPPPPDHTNKQLFEKNYGCYGSE